MDRLPKYVRDDLADVASRIYAIVDDLQELGMALDWELEVSERHLLLSHIYDDVQDVSNATFQAIQSYRDLADIIYSWRADKRDRY